MTSGLPTASSNPSRRMDSISTDRCKQTSTGNRERVAIFGRLDAKRHVRLQLFRSSRSVQVARREVSRPSPVSGESIDGEHHVQGWLVDFDARQGDRLFSPSAMRVADVDVAAMPTTATDIAGFGFGLDVHASELLEDHQIIDR